MVDPETDVVINSEESQTAFERQQTIMQPPPIKKEMQQKQKKTLLIIGGIIIFLGVVIGMSVYLAGQNSIGLLPEEKMASPTPTTIYTDPLKEAELQRIEELVKNVDPETLLILPPQVDMRVTF